MADACFSDGIHIITGRIGSGKSTLAAILAGIQKPDTGSIKKSKISSSIYSMQFPEYHLTHMQIDKEIRSWGLDFDAVMKEAELNYPEEKDPMNLSRGELKRLHLACITQKKYDLMILDEPFSSLDCIWKKKFCDLLEDTDAGIRILFTHEQRFLPACDHLWKISGGVLAKIK